MSECTVCTKTIWKGAVLYTAESRSRYENPEKNLKTKAYYNPDWV